VESAPKPNPKFLLSRKEDQHLQDFEFQCSLNKDWLITGEVPNHVIDSGQYQLLVYGDLINPEILVEFKGDLSSLISASKGHFTLLHVDQDKIHVASSLFSFLPVYYSTKKMVIANHWETIKPFSQREVDEDFIIESHLFNYPIDSSTLYIDIKVLDSFTLLSLEDRSMGFDAFIDVSDWFPSQVDTSINLVRLSEQFVQSCQRYFDQEKELITFTSGFDGRTILGTALAQGCSVQTFSMGRMENDDVYNPLSNAQELNIPFEVIDLASEKYLTEFAKSAQSMSIVTGGRNGFLYPHFQYCAAYFQDYPVLLTGYCGSELFRALHIAGAVTSRELVSIFLEKTNDEMMAIIKDSPRLRMLKPEMVERRLPVLMQKLLDLRARRASFRNTNHFFYFFIFKQVFRKVFGFWTQAQFEYLKVRTPFLDGDFIKRLLQSEYAGCNNEFFTHNPLKRYKGQLLYAQILKTLQSPLFKMMTGKNYRPDQLLSLTGQLSIVIPYLKKKWKRKRRIPNIDNLALITGYQRTWPEIAESLDWVQKFYQLDQVKEEVQKMSPTMSESTRDMLFQIASLSLTLKYDEVGGIDRLQE
jgi:hypothetical protein